MSVVTDVILILPTWQRDAVRKFEKVFEESEGYEPAGFESGGKCTSWSVYHIGVNHIGKPLMDLLDDFYNWASEGAVLLTQYEDDGPRLKIQGYQEGEPPSGWAAYMSGDNMKPYLVRKP